MFEVDATALNRFPRKLRDTSIKEYLLKKDTNTTEARSGDLEEDEKVKNVKVCNKKVPPRQGCQSYSILR